LRQPRAIEVSGRHIRSIRISRAGWVFILLTLGLGVGGLNSGNNLIYLLFGMLLSMLVINAILSRSSLAGLEFRFRLPQRLYAETENRVHVDILNRKKRLPSYALTLIPQTEKRARPSEGYFVVKVPPGGTSGFVHSLRFEHRGRVQVPGFMLSTSYPFGLIEKFIPIHLDCERVVYPKLDDNAVDVGVVASREGDFLSGQRGHGVNPYGVREYVYGDDMRRIHWPSVAKVGAWMTREFEHEKTPRILFNLIVDPGRPAGAEAVGKRERTVSALATMLVHSIRRNREVGLMINGSPVESSGSGYLDFYLTVLAVFDQDQSEAVRGSARRPVHSEESVIGLSELPRGRIEASMYDRLVFADGAPA
jgi:uncharacterized protein (DUF58 family)